MGDTPPPLQRSPYRRRAQGINAIKELRAETRDDTVVSLVALAARDAHHAVRLARARLTVSKEAAVVAFEALPQERAPNVVVDCLLCCKGRISLVVGVKGVIVEEPRTCRTWWVRKGVRALSKGVVGKGINNGRVALTCWSVLAPGVRLSLTAPPLR